MTVYVDTVYVDTDFLLAIMTDSDWHQLSVKEVLETYEVENRLSRISNSSSLIHGTILIVSHS